MRRFFRYLILAVLTLTIAFPHTLLSAQAAPTLEDAVVSALSRVGENGFPTNNWWSDGTGDDEHYWCARFVSKAFVESGMGELVGAYSGAKGNDYGHGFEYPDEWWEWYAAQGRARTRASGYTPKRGDLVFYDWNVNDGTKPMSDNNHVGIVLEVRGSNIYTVEGNVSLAKGTEATVRKSMTKKTNRYVVGYGDNNPTSLAIELTVGQAVDAGRDLTVTWSRQTGTGVMYSLYMRDIAETEQCYRYDWFDADALTIPGKHFKAGHTYNIAVRAVDKYGKTWWSVVKVSAS